MKRDTFDRADGDPGPDWQVIEGAGPKILAGMIGGGSGGYDAMRQRGVFAPRQRSTLRYAGSSLQAGLEGYWRLGSDAQDSHVTGRHLVNVGGVTFTGDAAVCTWSSSLASPAAAVFDCRESFTCAVWGYRADHPSDNPYVGLMGGGGQSWGQPFVHGAAPTYDCSAFGRMWIGGIDYYGQTLTPSLTGVWSLFLFRFNKATATFRVTRGDTLVSTYALPGAPNPSDALTFGYESASGIPWRGSLKRAAFWSRELTDDECTWYDNDGIGLEYHQVIGSHLGYIGVAARMSPGSGGANWIAWFQNGSVEKRLNGVQISVGTLTTPWTLGDQVAMDFDDGTTCRLIKNGVVLHTFTVAEGELAGGNPGIVTVYLNALGDDWIGTGDAPPGTIVPVLQRETDPGVWVDLTADVIVQPIRWSRGIFGAGPLDRIARPGSLSFSLDNTASNSVRTESYYSPGHPACAAAWRHGARVRLWLTDGTVGRYVFRGRLQSIAPEPALAGLRMVPCTAADWLTEFAQQDAIDVPLLVTTTADLALDALVDLLPDPPAQIAFDAATDVFEAAFDDLGGNIPKAITVAQDLVQSEMGFLYVRGDDTDGETLTFESRTARSFRDPVFTFQTEQIPHDASALEGPATLEHLVNDVEVQTRPVRFDPAATVVLVKQDRTLMIEPGETIELKSEYKDPVNEAESVGAMNMLQPAPGQDYVAYTNADGTGADITADVTAVGLYWGSRAVLTLTNTGTLTAYVRGPAGAAGMQARGRGVYRYRPVSSVGVNQASIDRHGRRPLSSPLLMPYQSARIVGQGAADYLAHLYGDLSRRPTRMWIANDDAVLAAQCIVRDIGDCVDVPIDESAFRAFIHAVEGEITIDQRVTLQYTLAPADTSEVFILDDPVAGVLDARVLGYM